MEYSSDVAFTPSVKRFQEQRGSRASYARMEEQRGGFAEVVNDELAEFIAQRDSVFLATASKDGQPYVQHRGGCKGFIHVLDEHTLAFADFVGNKQYITTGNLAENDRALLFLMDYEHRERIKIWGRARVVVDDPVLLTKLRDPSDESRVEQAIVFTVTAWDANCPQHIPQLVHADDVVARVTYLEGALKAAGVHFDPA